MSLGSDAMYYNPVGYGLNKSGAMGPAGELKEAGDDILNWASGKPNYKPSHLKPGPELSESRLGAVAQQGRDSKIMQGQGYSPAVAAMRQQSKYNQGAAYGNARAIPGMSAAARYAMGSQNAMQQANMANTQEAQIRAAEGMAARQRYAQALASQRQAGIQQYQAAARAYGAQQHLGAQMGRANADATQSLMRMPFLAGIGVM